MTCALHTAPIRQLRPPTDIASCVALGCRSDVVDSSPAAGAAAPWPPAASHAERFSQSNHQPHLAVYELVVFVKSRLKHCPRGYFAHTRRRLRTDGWRRCVTVGELDKKTFHPRNGRVAEFMKMFVKMPKSGKLCFEARECS
jgi:hypothetical protein